MSTITSKQSGFTLVELIVTIIISGIFIGSITSMSVSVGNSANQAHRFEVATNLAYNNMRIYANGQKASDFGFVCNGDDVTDTEATTPYNDGAKHPDAAGTPLINTTSSSAIYDLPAPVVQTVKAVAPYGCGNTISGMPVRIVSTVTYGSPAKKVVHATYVGY
jgi:prepilin-type N-terminal cleavage/methylation domain-containing protein